jgi:hypothetical protein
MTQSTRRRRFAALTLGGILVCARTSSAELIDRVLAIVGGQIVTLSDAHMALAVGIAPPDGADPIGSAVSALIDRHLVLVEVDRYALPEPDDTTIAARMEGLRAELARRVPGNLPLRDLTLSDDRLHEIARNDVRIEVYLAQRFGVVQPTDADVAQYYRDHPELFTRGGVQVPLVEVQADARQRLSAELRQRLIDGWIADLRRRANINVLYKPATPGKPEP